jgi:hypothetical protein
MAVVFARRDVIVLRPCVMYEVCRCEWKVGPHACQRVTEISSYGQNPTLSNTGGRQMGLIWAGADWSVHLNRVPHDGPWSAGGVPTIGKVRGRRSFVFANRPRQPPKLSVPFTPHKGSARRGISCAPFGTNPIRARRWQQKHYGADHNLSSVASRTCAYLILSVVVIACWIHGS